MGAREAQPSMLLMGVKCLAHAQEYNTMTRLRLKPRPLDIESSTSPFERQLRVQCIVSKHGNEFFIIILQIPLLSYKFHFYLSGHFNLCGMENQRTSP